MERNPRRASASAPIALCSVDPHIGILDSWLPVLWELKHRHPDLSLVALLPERSVLRGACPADVIAELSERLFDRVVVPTKDGELIIFDSFQDVLNAAQHHDNGRFHADTHRNELPAARQIALRDFGDSVELVCLDIRRVAALVEILPAFRKAKLFSLPHGSNLRVWNSDHRLSEHVDPRIAEQCVAYLQSPQEASFHCEKFGLPDRNLRIVGVVRHAPSWVERIKSFGRDEERPTAPYIFLASRRSRKNPVRLGIEQKRESLEQLRKLAQALNCKLVIRRHPSEGEEAVFGEALGIERYGTHWMYSSLHPFILGSGALFGVTFRSSIAVDMTVLGTPTIELFDFEGPGLSEDPAGDRRLFVKPDGRLTSFYQRHGLVLGARNYAELKMRAEEILNDREGVARRLTAAYRELYTILPNPIAYVADDIESAVPSLARSNASSLSG